jgi:hypothetical protein
MQNDVLRRATLKREMAALFRHTAPGLSFPQERELLKQHADELERQAEELERNFPPLQEECNSS